MLETVRKVISFTYIGSLRVNRETPKASPNLSLRYTFDISTHIFIEDLQFAGAVGILLWFNGSMTSEWVQIKMRNTFAHKTEAHFS